MELQETAAGNLDSRRPGPREVRIRTRVSLMSTGTELTALTRQFEAGTHWEQWVTYPFYPGYSTVAEVEEIGESVRDIKVGSRVVARTPHASDHVIPAEQLVPTPDEISDEEAAWFALAKIACGGISAAGASLTGNSIVDSLAGARVAVVGAGPIGQMTVRWLAALGVAPVTIVDRNQNRLAMAREGGATSIIGSHLGERHEELVQVLGALGGQRPNIVFDTTGNPEILERALRIVADHGKVVIVGDTGFPSRQRLTSDVVVRGIGIVGAHDLHARQGGGWQADHAIVRRFFHLAAAGQFPLAGLITHRFLPSQAEEAYRMAQSSKGQTMGIVFDWL